MRGIYKNKEDEQFWANVVKIAQERMNEKIKKDEENGIFISTNFSPYRNAKEYYGDLNYEYYRTGYL